MAEVVAFDQVSMRYGLREELFRKLSFTLFPGSFHFLTGVSGSGKTTLLKLIYMDAFPTQGAVRLFGRDTKTIATRDIPYFRQRLGIVFQEFNLFSHLNLLENVSLPLKIRGYDKHSCYDHGMEILNWVGLSDHVYDFPSTLSGGQVQRAAIARAVITKPHLLLADEPTGNVDDDNAKKILYLFEQLNKMGTTVLLATHDRDLAANYSYPELNLIHGELFLHENTKLNSQKGKGIQLNHSKLVSSKRALSEQ